MSNITKLVVKPVQLLWSPKPKINSAWRITASKGQVIDIVDRLKPVVIEPVIEPVKPKRKNKRKKPDIASILDQAIELVNSEGQWLDDHYSTDENNSIAEFVSSMNYGDLDIDYSRLDDDIKSKLDLVDEKHWDDLIAESCILQYIPDYHNRDNEINSCNIGEVETEMSDDLKDLIAQLSENDIDNINRSSDYYISGDYIYSNFDYHRWSMVVDDELFNNNLKDLIADNKPA